MYVLACRSSYRDASYESKKVVAERSAAGVTTADASVAARETAAQHVGNNARSVPLEVADEPFTCS